MNAKEMFAMRPNQRTGVVACTCNPATLDVEFWNGVGSISVEGKSPSIGGRLCDHL